MEDAPPGHGRDGDDISTTQSRPQNGRARSFSLRSIEDRRARRRSRAKRASNASSITAGLAMTNHLSIFDDIADRDEVSIASETIVEGEAVQSGKTSKSIAVCEVVVSDDLLSPISTRKQPGRPPTASLREVWAMVVKYGHFVGPGFMVSVALMDPGNYSADIAAGAAYGFKPLFTILLGNIFAVFLQALSTKLGSVTGLNLAQMIKLHFPPWLNVMLYLAAEMCILCIDLAEVIGFAIALNMLFKLDLVGGCLLSIADVVVVLAFYRPDRSMRNIRIFEFGVLLLVLGIIICLCFQLSMIDSESVGEVLRGYLPSSALVEPGGIYQSCGIIGSAVMPHSLYLGSGTVQSRLLQFDRDHHLVAQRTKVLGSDDYHLRRSKGSRTRKRKFLSATSTATSMGSLAPIIKKPINPGQTHYAPSIGAIRYCLPMSLVELIFAVGILALFANSAILIISGAALHEPRMTLPDAPVEDASLFGIYDLLVHQTGHSAGVLFAIAILLAGTTVGIGCTIAGQMISAAQGSRRLTPWVRRILTRTITIVPSVVIAATSGKNGMSRALEATQVVLCFFLPMIIAPLIYFTSRAQYCGVNVAPNGERIVHEEDEMQINGLATDPGVFRTTSLCQQAEMDDLPDLAPFATEATEFSSMQVSNECLTALSNTTNRRSKAVTVADPVAEEIEDPQITSSAIRFITDEPLELISSAPKYPEQDLGRANCSTQRHGNEGAIAPWMDDDRSGVKTVQFRNHWVTTTIACLIWGLITVMNVAMLCMLAFNMQVFSHTEAGI